MLASSPRSDRVFTGKAGRAGGFGREVLHWARAAWPEWCGRIAGFLSADREILAGRPDALPVLDDPATFTPQPGDALLLAIGIPGVRRQVAESLSARGAEFLTLVHPTAVVASTAALGSGTIVCPHAVVSDAAQVGRCVLVNYHASLAHDSVAGISPSSRPMRRSPAGPASAQTCFWGCMRRWDRT